MHADIYLILAATEIHNQGAATGISRLRATGLMLRNGSLPFLAACVLAAIEAATAHDTPVSAIFAVLFAAAALSVLSAGLLLTAASNDVVEENAETFAPDYIQKGGIEYLA